jgi:hypothetical protein
VLTHPLSDLLAPSVRLIDPNLPSAAADAIAAVLLVAGGIRLWRRRERMLTLLLVVPVLLTYAVFEAAGLDSAPRLLSYLQLPVLVLGAFGLVELVMALSARGRRRAALAAAIAFALALQGFHEANNTFRNHAEVPLENFKQAAALATEASVRLMFTNSVDAEGLAYYLGAKHVRRISTVTALDRLCAHGGVLRYMEDPSPASPNVDTSCLAARGATRIPLRSAHRLILWLAPAEWPRANPLTTS